MIVQLSREVCTCTVSCSVYYIYVHKCSKKCCLQTQRRAKCQHFIFNRSGLSIFLWSYPFINSSGFKHRQACFPAPECSSSFLCIVCTTSSFSLMLKVPCFGILLFTVHAAYTAFHTTPQCVATKCIWCCEYKYTAKKCT